MTPAYAQSKATSALVTRYGSTYVTDVRRSVAETVAVVQASIPPGWRAVPARGTEPPDVSGAVLVGAVHAPDGDVCDHNLYIYPYTAEAMLLRDTVDRTRPGAA